MSATSAYGAPIPLTELEGVLAWVDTFKLSRPTKKINRDFSDAVLLAEILSVHYPKLVEMHNYPPRNSHALKLNNWMTLNRKVLKKLKLNLCVNTMEQLSHSTPGVIERVLVMVKDKIKRDEEIERSTKETEQNMSSGGSYYEACGDEEHVLVVPVKARVNGVLECLQQKVVNYDAYLALKEELKDAKEAVEALKQKVDHLDNVIKLKDERIVELQKELERKQTRHKKFEEFQNSLNIPFDDLPIPVVVDAFSVVNKNSGPFKVVSKPKIPIEELKPAPMMEKLEANLLKVPPTVPAKPETLESKIPAPKVSATKIASSKPSINELTSSEVIQVTQEVLEVDKVKSDVFKEAELVELKPIEQDEEFKDSEPGNILTIEGIIEKELSDISNAADLMKDEQTLNKIE